MMVAFVFLPFFSSVALADLQAAQRAYDERRYELAYSIWLPIARDGHPSAQYNLATLYRFGRGVEISTPAAMEWYRRAARQGHALSRSILVAST